MTDENDPTLAGLPVREVQDVADGVNEETFGVRADQLERILNGRIAPVVGLHAALVGACLLVLAAAPATAITCGALAVALVALSLLRSSQQGFAGAGATFAVAAVLMSPLTAAATFVGLLSIFGALVLLILSRRLTSHELLFAPAYSALMIVSSSHSAQAWMLFAPAMLAGVAVALLDRRRSMAFGSLLGFVIIIYNNHNLSLLPLSVSALAILGLIIYTVRALRTQSSDLVNFLAQGVVCLVVVSIAQLFFKPPPILWPISLAAFFIGIYLVRRRLFMMGAATWIVLLSVAAAWSYGPRYELFSSAENWRTALAAYAATLAGAIFLGWAARQFLSSLAADVGMLLCLLVAFLAGQQMTQAVARAANAAPGAVVFRTEGSSLLTALAAAVVALPVVAFLYLPIQGAKHRPWWQGLMPESSVKFGVGVVKAAAKWFASVPIVGWVLSLVVRAAASLRYLKSGGAALRLADIAALMTVGYAATAATSFLNGVSAGRAIELLSMSGLADMSWSAAVAYGMCAVLLYGFGLLIRETLFMFAAVYFVAVPFVSYALMLSVAQAAAAATAAAATATGSAASVTGPVITADLHLLGGMSVGLGLVLVLCGIARSLLGSRMVAQTAATALPASPEMLLPQQPSPTLAST